MPALHLIYATDQELLPVVTESEFILSLTIIRVYYLNAECVYTINFCFQNVHDQSMPLPLKHQIEETLNKNERKLTLINAKPLKCSDTIITLK